MATCDAAAEKADEVEDEDEGRAGGCNEVEEDPGDSEVAEEDDDDDDAAALRKLAGLASVAEASPCPGPSLTICIPDPDPDPPPAQLTLLAILEGLAADSDVSLLEQPPESLQSSLSLHISSMSSSSILSILNLPYLLPICLLLPVMRFLCRLIIRRTLHCPSTISSLASIEVVGKQVIDVESLFTKWLIPSFRALSKLGWLLKSDLTMKEPCSYSRSEFSTNSVSASTTLGCLLGVLDWHAVTGRALLLATGLAREDVD